MFVQEIRKAAIQKFSFAEKSKISWDEFVKLASFVAKFYQFPVNVIICQAALETGRGSSEICRLKNNYFGFMAYDKATDQARKYSTALDSIIDYLELITTDPRYSQASKAKTPFGVIKAICKAGYASDPKYVEKITSLEEWNIKR